MTTTPTLWSHEPVLLRESIQAVFTRPQGRYVDATFGRGGHTRALLDALGAHGQVLALDRDPQAIEAAQDITDVRLHARHAPFSSMEAQAAELGWAGVDGVLMDLGVSSPQLDDASRGFSFRADAPLDMRMDTTQGQTVAEFLAIASERQLAEVIRDYGEERFAVSIAKAIVSRRQSGHPIGSTRELAEVVAGAVKTREPGQNPATRTFQALRIYINAELEELQQGLEAAVRLLLPAGRLAVISFHSLEDRMVKTFIGRESRDEVDRRAPFAPPRPCRLTRIARVRPSDEEVQRNPRSRSAILRVAQRTEVNA